LGNKADMTIPPDAIDIIDKILSPVKQLGELIKLNGLGPIKSQDFNDDMYQSLHKIWPMLKWLPFLWCKVDPAERVCVIRHLDEMLFVIRKESLIGKWLTNDDMWIEVESGDELEQYKDAVTHEVPAGVYRVLRASEPWYAGRPGYDLKLAENLRLLELALYHLRSFVENRNRVVESGRRGQEATGIDQTPHRSDATADTPMSAYRESRNNVQESDIEADPDNKTLGSPNASNRDDKDVDAELPALIHRGLTLRYARGDFTFKKEQAKVIKVLWENYRGDNEYMHEEEVLEKASKGTTTFRNVFRSSWDNFQAVIEQSPESKHLYRLRSD